MVNYPPPSDSGIGFAMQPKRTKIGFCQTTMSFPSTKSQGLTCSQKHVFKTEKDKQFPIWAYQVLWELGPDHCESFTFSWMV